MRNLTAKFFLLVFVVLLLVPLKAQNVASITGVVTDPTKAVIPNVNIILENTLTGVTYVSTTNAVGSYTFNEIKPGPGYKIAFSHDGFKPLTISDIYLNVDTTRTQNARLSIGSAAQTVEVSATNENETLDTTDATIGNSVEVQELNNLPIQNRDSPSALFYQQPGVTLDGAVTGARVDQSNVTLDGLDVNQLANGAFGAIIGTAPVDSVQEFRGVTAGQLSSAGEGGGGQFELVTRSGTNNFHGALVEYHRDTDLEANDWFNNNSGTKRPPLVRNQFGGNVGGPILKNRAFFFFDYNGRKDARSYVVDRTVPMGTNTSGFRGGFLSYVDGNGAANTLTTAQLNGYDPQGVGFNSPLLSLIQKRYPVANDLTGNVGDGVNTAGYRFNAPRPYNEKDFVQRVDYNLNDKMKIFGRGTFERVTLTFDPIQFPGDPETYPESIQGYSWVVGHTWSISNTKVNQITYGQATESTTWQVAYNPQGDNQYSFGGSGGVAGLSGAYAAGDNSQARYYPVPVVKDDFSWEKGRHSLTFGGTFKWETPNESAIENFNFPTVGLGGYTTGLAPQLRPNDIGSDYTTIYDTAFAVALAPITANTSNFYYNTKGVVQKQNSALDLIYRNYETELYFGDTWKLTPRLTISYGVRYQNYSVPYETNGKQSTSALSTSQKLTFSNYFGDRLAQSAAGDSTNTDVPFIQYSLGGKVNNAPGYYHSNNKDFAPRIALAFTPGSDNKSVFSVGGGIVYDHSIVNALQFQQLQASYLFEASNTIYNGVSGDPVASLTAGHPRFGGIDAAIAQPSVPVVTPPFVPFVSGGVPDGLAIGQGNIDIDPGLKTPYSIMYNAGFQHEFPQGYILKLGYVGRQGRRLLAEADASQLIDFPDSTKKSSQMMSAAMAGMTKQLRANKSLGALGAIQSLDAQPWFEDMLPTGTGTGSGLPVANNTQYVAYTTYPYPQRGDFADTIAGLAQQGAIGPNVGMASQFSYDTFWTNKGFSSYNALIVTLHKNAGYGLQFDLNYTWAHSIDNVSFGANNLAANSGFGFICDVVRPRECRGNSDFDVTNYLNGSFEYELPFGRGKNYATTAPFWLNEAIGGWSISGLPTWHTGPAYNAFSNAYVAGYANNAPATLTGPIALLKAKTNGGKGSSLNAFSDPVAARAAFTGPTGFNIGSRNNLRGPGYFNIDLGLGKTFPVYRNKVNLKFRVDAFNATNHPNFDTPGAGTSSNGADITQASGVPFGTITQTVVPPGSDLAARVLQGALRLEF